MKMVGHKTESIYQRYAIVDEAMHRKRQRSWTHAARADRFSRGREGHPLQTATVKEWLNSPADLSALDQDR